MFQAAQETGLFLGEAFHYRYHPLAERVRTLIHDGTIGRLTHLEALFAVPIPPTNIRWDWSLAGGATMDLGCYPLHMLHEFSGMTPRVVRRHGEDGTAKHRRHDGSRAGASRRRACADELLDGGGRAAQRHVHRARRSRRVQRDQSGRAADGPSAHREDQRRREAGNGSRRRDATRVSCVRSWRRFAAKASFPPTARRESSTCASSTTCIARPGCRRAAT